MNPNNLLTSLSATKVSEFSDQGLLLTSEAVLITRKAELLKESNKRHSRLKVGSVAYLGLLTGLMYIMTQVPIETAHGSMMMTSLLLTALASIFVAGWATVHFLEADELASVLMPLNLSKINCERALELCKVSPDANKWRKWMIENRGQLRHGDLAIMQALHDAEKEADSQEACLKLHSADIL